MKHGPMKVKVILNLQFIISCTCTVIELYLDTASGRVAVSCKPIYHRMRTGSSIKEMQNVADAFGYACRSGRQIEHQC